MATYYADNHGVGDQPNTGIGVHVAYGEYDLTAAQVSTSHEFLLCKLPKGATLLDVTVGATDLDTNGSPTVTFDVGLSVNPDQVRFANALTLGQGGGVAQTTRQVMDDGGIGFYVLPTEDWLKIKFDGAAATAAAGTLKATVEYTMAQK